MKKLLLFISLVICLNAFGQNTYKNIYKSTSPYGINAFGNMYIGDSTLTALITWVFYGSSLTASPGPCSAIGWVAQMASERQFIPVDSAIPGTGISPNCPVNPSLAMIHRIAGFPVHTAGGKFLFDAGVNDVYSDSVAYALALGQILDSLTMNRGWAASDIYVISSFRASTFTDTQLLKVNIKVCAPRGVNIIDVLHPLYYHYHYLNQNTNCPDSTHPTTLGMLIAENVITNSLPFGSFRGNVTITGNTLNSGTLTVNGTDSLNGKTYLVGGLQQRVNDGHIDVFGIQTNGGDYGEFRFITANVSAGDSMSLRHTVQAGNGSSFDLWHYKTTGQVLIAHFGGSTDATVLGGSTPLAGYLLTVNGNASMAQANVTAGLYVAGDANYQDYRLPLFTNGSTHIAIGINSSNLIKIDNGFGGLAFGSGGASFAAKIEFLLNGHLILNAPNSITDTLSAWLQVKGLSYLGDSVNLGRVATGTTADSVLMIGANHFVHKLAFSAFGGGGGGFTNPMTTTNDMIFQTGGTYARLAAPGHDGMVLKSISGSLGWGDTTAAGTSLTTAAISATAVTNGVDITTGILTLHSFDATHGGVVTTGSQTFPGQKTFSDGSIFGFASGTQAYIRGSGGVFIQDNGTSDINIGSSATTSTTRIFMRTTTQYNTSDINGLGQMDITGNFLFNSTSGSTGGRLLVSGGNVFEDAMSSTGGFNWRTNAGGTTLATLVGATGNLLLGTTTDVPTSIFTPTSTAKGDFPAPIMTLAQFTAISSKATGLHAILSDSSNKMAIYNGTKIVTYATTDQLSASSTPGLQTVLNVSGTLSNSNTITTPASNNLTFSGGQFAIIGNYTWNPSSGIINSRIELSPGTLNDATNTGTVTNAYVIGTTTPVLTASSAVTYTNAYTEFINAAPSASTNVTITNAYALGVGGATLIQGDITSTHQYDNTSTPGIAAGTGAGTSPTVSVSGTDQSGVITVTTGTAPTLSAVVATITYASGYSFKNASYPILYPANAATALLSGTSMVFTTGSTSNFTITAGSIALSSATAYSWYYKVGAR